MKKTEKAAMIILIPLLIILFILYSLINQYKISQRSVLVYPEGTLSDSLFVSQNNTYTANDSFPNKTAFRRVPYYIDLPSGTLASVGQGSIVQLSDSIYVFISEYEQGDAESVILSEFPSALLIDYDPLYTYSQRLKEQTGYINGFSASYIFDMISVSNGTAVKTAYLAAYDLSGVEDEESQNHIVVSVITTNIDSGSFAHIKLILDTITLTVRYDQKLSMEQEKSRKTEEESAEEPTKEDSRPEESEPPESPQSYNDLVTEYDYDARVIPISITKTYGDLFINILTDHYIEESEMTLYGPSLEPIGEKVLSEDGLTVQFQVGEITEEMLGDYVLKVTYYGDYLDFQLQVGDAAENKGEQE